MVPVVARLRDRGRAGSAGIAGERAPVGGERHGNERRRHNPRRADARESRHTCIIAAVVLRDVSRTVTR